MINEINRLLSYSEKQYKLSFLRVNENQEIDLIVEKGGRELFLCGIKSTDRVDDRHTRSLITLGKDFHKPKLRLISRDRQTKRIGDVVALHWDEAIQEICGVGERPMISTGDET